MSSQQFKSCEPKAFDDYKQYLKDGYSSLDTSEKKKYLEICSRCGKRWSQHYGSNCTETTLTTQE